jgi:ankyrin repeat protein
MTVRDGCGRGVIADAAISDRSEALEALIELGAPIDVPNSRSQTELSAAIANHKTNNALLLVAAGAAPTILAYNGMTPLFVAINAQERTVLRAMIARGLDPNVESPEGRTALIHALESRDAETTKVLLESGAQVNLRLRNGDTPVLFVAKQFCAPDLIRLLISFGADVNATDAQGSSAAQASVGRQNCGNADALREASAGGR